MTNFCNQHLQARKAIRRSGWSLKTFQTIIKNQHEDGGLSAAWLESRWPNNNQVKEYAQQYLQRYDYFLTLEEAA
jgi:hypothetical protein